MTDILTKLVIVIIIIITTIVVYTLLCERSELRREGLENKDIKNTIDVILKEPLKNLCTMASSDSVMLDGKASIVNIDKLLRKGVRWLDFFVTEKDGVPFASDKIKFDNVLNVCKASMKLGQNPNMPLFINIRVSSNGSEPFYNNIHNFILKTFTVNELYNKPGEVKTLLSDTKKNVMKIINVFKKDTNESVNKIKEESFTNTNHIIGTESELYENLTLLEFAYKDNNTNGIEGMEGIEGTEGAEEIEELKASNKAILELSKKANKVEIDAKKEKKQSELNKSLETEPVVGAIPSVQREIDKLRNSESMLRLQNETLGSDVLKLKKANSSYSNSITSIGKQMNKMTKGVHDKLTKQVQCDRCVTGNTLLGELGDKVVFIITRSQYVNDAYNKSKLSLSAKDGCINVEVMEGEKGEDENFYNVLYSSDNTDIRLPANIMKITNVPLTTSNTINMIKNNIERRNIQVLQVSNLENKSEYINMFKHFESAFIPMSSILKYIHERL